MRFLVIGCGSIGRRHAKNLISLGHRVTVVDLLPANRQWAEDNLHIKAYADPASALSPKPDAVLICTPPSTHLSLAALSLKAGCHLFIEKPVSNTSKGTSKLLSLAKKSKKIVQVGYNLRYVPALAKLKETILSKKYGRPLFARACFSQYLPYWRPGTDYRKGYTGKKSLGGGLILECTHELDYVCWLLGKPKRLTAVARKISGLEIDTEDTADISIDFGSSLASIHLDFLRQDYARGCEVICEKGTLVWKLDRESGKSTLVALTYDQENKKIWPETLLDIPWAVNDMYVAEMKSFIHSIETRKPAGPTLEDGLLSLILAEKSLLSSKKGASVKV